MFGELLEGQFHYIIITNYTLPYATFQSICQAISQIVMHRTVKNNL